MTTKILIANENAADRESLKKILEANIDLILTDSIEQCLDILKNDPPVTLLIIDKPLALQDGVDHTLNIKQQYPQLKVALISGYQSETSDNEQGAAHHDATITKPFETAKIQKIAQM